MSMKLWTLAALAGPLAILLALQLGLVCCSPSTAAFPPGTELRRGSGVRRVHRLRPRGDADCDGKHDRGDPRTVLRRAFLVVPLVGAFFIDIANAILIRTFLAAV